MRLFGPMIALILVEIALFVTIGGRIGLLASLAVIFGTAALGGLVLRRGGERAAGEFRAAMAGIGKPEIAVGDHALVMLAGVLLILPGFLGDTVGLLLLLPPVRALIGRWARGRVQTRTQGFETQDFGVRQHPDVVIDGEFIELDPDEAPPQGGSQGRSRKSGWTQH